MKADPIREEIYAFRALVREKFDQRDFAHLETLYRDSLASRRRFKSGNYYMFQFMAPFDDYTRGGQKADLEGIELWKRAFPKSALPWVTESEVWRDYAWEARGGGWASEVTEQGWKLFRERLNKAQLALDTAEQLEPPTPNWYENQMIVSVGLGAPRERLDSLYLGAKRALPESYAADETRSLYLLPRWMGKPGEWERLAKETLKQEGASGLETYARIVAYRSRYYTNIVEETQISVPLAHAGFRQWMERFPESKEAVARYCLFAVNAGDRPLAKQLLEKLDGTMDPDIWITGDYYHKFVTWLMAQ
ncbi:MAG TPA: DUF4034 domain-containing protein [Opitutaceae bacterium]|jgi:hypothetical protein|nr:DUF4034 domain-containing protein [Opitutaceae bacterium]